MQLHRRNALLVLAVLVGCQAEDGAPSQKQSPPAPRDDAPGLAEQQGGAYVAMTGAAGAGGAAADATPLREDGVDATPPLMRIVHVDDRLRLTFDAHVDVLDASPDVFRLSSDDGAVDGDVVITRVAVKPDDPWVLELELDGAFAPDAIALLSYDAGSIEIGGKPLLPFDGVRVAPGKELFLLIGQSNMAGRGALDEAPAEALEHVGLLADGDSWVPASHPLNRYSSVGKDLSIQKVGPGYAFAEMAWRELGTEIGLVVNAQGGPGISAWQPGSSEGLLEAAIERVILGERSGALRGVLWHHGEANRNQAASYGAHVGTMLDALRAHFGNPTLHFVAGQLGTWSDANGPINEAIARLPDQLEHVSYVSGEGLERDGSGSHFSSAAQGILGRRYARAVLREVYGLEVPPSP